MAADCSELAKVITQLALHHAVKLNVDEIDPIVTEMKKELPDIDRQRVVDSINEATTENRKARSDIAKLLSRVKREAKVDKRTSDKIDEFKRHNEAGTQPVPIPLQRLAPEAIKKLRDEVKELKKQVPQLNENTERKLNERIAELEKHYAEGTVPPKQSNRNAVDPKIADLREQRDTLNEQIGRSEPATQEHLRKRLAEVEKQLGPYQEPEVGYRGQPYTEPTQKLADELAALTAQRDEIRRQAVYTKSLQEQIAEREEILKTGRVPAPPGTPIDQPSDIKALLEIRSGLDKAISKSEPVRFERLKKRLDELTKKLLDNNHAPPVKEEELPSSKRLAGMEYKVWLQQNKIERINENERERTRLEKAAEPINLQRAILFGLDFNQVLRQGKFVLAAHPVLGAKRIPEMLRAWASERAEYDYDKARDEHPLGALAHKAGLEQTREGGKQFGQEEQFRSAGLARKLHDQLTKAVSEKSPIAGKVVENLSVERFNRAYRVFSNSLRFNYFAALVEQKGGIDNISLEEAKILANLANVWTGRGAIHESLKPSLVAANQVLNAPQFQVSRFQTLIGQPLWGGKWAGSKEARKIVAKEYGRAFRGLTAYYSLIALGAALLADDDEEKPVVEINPKSSDFGKVKMGNTRIDPMAGVLQWSVFLTRMLSGQSKSTKTGELSDLRGPNQSNNNTGLDVANRFVRGRLAPVPGALYDRFLTGKTPDLQEATTARVLANLFTPATPKDIYRELTSHGMSKGAALAFIIWWGESVNTYTDRQTP